MENLKKAAAIIAGVAIFVFSVLAILGIWGVISEEVTLKSLGTLLVILVVTLFTAAVSNNLSKKK